MRALNKEFVLAVAVDRNSNVEKARKELWRLYMQRSQLEVVS
jgi:hypothetical protein